MTGTTSNWRRRSIGTTCGTCGAAMFIGPDADTAALQARVNTHPVTRTGELIAIAIGHRTYERDHQHHLHHRDRWAIRSPAKGTVHIDHHCGQPVPTAWRQPTTTHTTTTPEEPPF